MSRRTFSGAAVRVGTVLALLPAAFPSVQAQSVIYSATELEAVTEVGRMDDFDGDGIDDWWTAAPTGSEVVRIHSGANGGQLLFLQSGEPNCGFGASVAVDDVDRDGVLDFVIGSPFSDLGGRDAGRVQVLSGADLSILKEWAGLAPGDEFGSSVAVLHTPTESQVLIGSPRHTPSAGKPQAGLLQVYDGTTGALRFQFAGIENGSLLGFSVTALGRSSLGRFVVGAPFENGAGSNRGVVRSFRPADGKLISTFEGPLDNDRAGFQIDDLGDVDQDLFDDLSVTLSLSNSVFARAQVQSGATGVLLYEVPATGPLISVRAAGDVNGDGVPDLLASSLALPPGGGIGQHQLFSGVDGRLFETIPTVFNSRAVSTSGVGDLDGDGLLDFATAEASGGQTQIELRRGAEVFLNATPSAVFAGDTIQINGRFAAPGSPAILFLTSFDGTQFFLRIVGGTFDGTHAFDVVGSVPPGLTGHEVGLSLLVLDPVRGLLLTEEEKLVGL